MFLKNLPDAYRQSPRRRRGGGLNATTRCETGPAATVTRSPSYSEEEVEAPLPPAEDFPSGMRPAPQTSSPQNR